MADDYVANSISPELLCLKCDGEYEFDLEEGKATCQNCGRVREAKITLGHIVERGELEDG